MHLRLFAHLQEGLRPAADTLFALDGRGVLSPRGAKLGKEMGCNRVGRGVCYRQSGRSNGIPDYFWVIASERGFRGHAGKGWESQQKKPQLPGRKDRMGSGVGRAGCRAA